MKVQSIDQISKRDSPLHYRSTYDARATLADRSGDPVQKRIEVVVETDPFGKRSVSVKLVDPVDEPILPIIRELTSRVEELQGQGAFH